jgi:predicted alpha/beta-fold hydrolase
MPGLSDIAKQAGWSFAALAAIVRLSLVYPAFPQIAAAQALPVRIPEGVKEELFVPIGGIDQWITIKGGNRNNPVVLFLHGGPGDALSPFADAMFAGWEKDFTLVPWDQRGAGRTYGKSGLSTTTSSTMS